MFHTEAITPDCARALEILGEQPFISDFYLAGGTALALQIGHRLSADLDWFSYSKSLTESERSEIRIALEKGGEFKITSEKEGMLFTQLRGTEVSFVYQHHPLTQLTVPMDEVRLASPVDLGLMKLSAINSRGTRRDFVDIYCLRKIVTLDQLLELAPSRYYDRPEFLTISARALAYFEDAEQQKMPETVWPVNWQDVREYCESAAARWTRKLSGLN